MFDTHLIKNLRSHKMLYATVWWDKRDSSDQIQTWISHVNWEINYNVSALTCSAIMPNSPKQAYCTKFLLRMRTQPPVRTHTDRQKQSTSYTIYIFFRTMNVRMTAAETITYCDDHRFLVLNNGIGHLLWVGRLHRRAAWKCLALRAHLYHGAQRKHFFSSYLTAVISD